ncbi:MAG: NADH-quinone oxidoreductase subunit I [Puniceicoccales bacterium]|jgi:NADH-quinone oxidoreductase subunit I|nr:NADH-quinone oxidoreductase subunit I [Puniceicoccales bacterium]
MAIKVLERKPLTLLERTCVPQLLGGLKVTLQNMLRPKVTLEYPDQTPVIPPGYRGAPTLVKDPEGREKCVSCQLCEFICPSKAIRVTPGEIAADSPYGHVEKAPAAFEIDMLRCSYCGLCQEVCPEEALWLQTRYSTTGTSRTAFVNDKQTLLAMGKTLPDSHHKWDLS